MFKILCYTSACSACQYSVFFISSKIYRFSKTSIQPRNSLSIRIPSLFCCHFFFPTSNRFKTKKSQLTNSVIDITQANDGDECDEKRNRLWLFRTNRDQVPTLTSERREGVAAFSFRSHIHPGMLFSAATSGKKKGKRGNSSDHSATRLSSIMNAIQGTFSRHI